MFLNFLISLPTTPLINAITLAMLDYNFTLLKNNAVTRYNILTLINSIDEQNGVSNDSNR